MYKIVHCFIQKGFVKITGCRLPEKTRAEMEVMTVRYGNAPNVIMLHHAYEGKIIFVQARNLLQTKLHKLKSLLYYLKLKV